MLRIFCNTRTEYSNILMSMSTLKSHTLKLHAGTSSTYKITNYCHHKIKPSSQKYINIAYCNLILYSQNSNKMRFPHLLLLLCLSTVTTYPTINRLPIDTFRYVCNGTKLVSVLRLHTLNYSYALAGVKEEWAWKNYPEFNDFITLEMAQHVRIAYSITISTWPIMANFLTRMLINEKIQEKFIVVTPYTYERTNWSQHFVYLQKGTYKLQVQYMQPHSIPIQHPQNSDWIKPYFQIEYLKEVKA